MTNAISKALTALVTGLVAASAAWAMPSFQGQLFSRYPNAAISLAGCVACHEGASASTINPFGNAFRANGFVFDAVLEALDSDGDGSTNLAELTASPATGPGDPTSYPPAAGGDTTPPVVPPVATANYTGVWWNPSESGWGLNLSHQDDVVFATLYTYDDKGVPMWVFMSGKVQADGQTYTGDLYQATGPAFNAQPFAGVKLSQVGTMSIKFASASSATLSYTYAGVSVTKQVVQQVFGTAAATCTSTKASRASLTNYQDLWWNPAESGWGINLAHQNNTLFALMMNYDLNGNDTWLLMSGTRGADGSYVGDLYRMRGRAFNAQPFLPLTAADASKVGTMRFTFTDGNNGTVVYTVDGIQVTKSITRQVFGASAPACTSPTPSTPSTDGATLYGTYCAACHGTLSNSAKGGTTLSRMQAAIAGNAGGMGYLSNLTGSQLQAIADALAPVSGGTPACGSCHSIPPNLGNHLRHDARVTCSSCHGGGYSSTTVNAATHMNGLKDVLASVGWNAATNSCANGCHGTASWTPTATLTCNSCHGMPPTSGDHAKHEPRATCATCHGAGFSTMTVDATLHNNGTKNVVASVGWNAASNSCTNSCHGSAPWTSNGSLACNSCHAMPPTSGKHSKHSRESVTCSQCHGSGFSTTAVNAALHNNGTKDIVASAKWNASAKTCTPTCHRQQTW